MADEKAKFPLRLYDAEGHEVSQHETDEDMTTAANRERTISHDGKTYVWNQRNGQYRESGETLKLGSASRVENKAEPAPANKAVDTRG